MIEQIMLEAGVGKVNEQDDRAKNAFPAAPQRLRDAATAIPADNPAAPFGVALMELVQARAGITGFVRRHRWADIIDRHFTSQDDPA